MQLLQRWLDQFRDAVLARAMRDAGHVGYFEYRFDGDRFAWGRGMCRLFGVQAPPKGGIAQWYARVREADRARVEREFWTACALRRPSVTLDYGIDIPEGPARFVTSRLSLTYGADERPSVMSGVTVDVTDRQLDALRRAKDELLAALNHRLRTPLGALTSAAEVLKVLPPNCPDAAEARAVIARQTARLAQMLDELDTRFADESPPQTSADIVRPPLGTHSLGAVGKNNRAPRSPTSWPTH